MPKISKATGPSQAGVNITPEARAGDHSLGTARATVTGGKGGNAAVTSLVKALADLGLIIDSTS